MLFRCVAVVAALLPGFGLSAQPAAAQEAPRFGKRLEGFAYPHPSQEFRFTSQRQDLAMSFMDIRP